MTAPFTPPPDPSALFQSLLGLIGQERQQPPRRPPSMLEAIRSYVDQLELAARDATQVENRPRGVAQRTVGPATPGNTPLPETTVQSQYQPSYDKAMNLLADFLPVLGEARGVQGGVEAAQQGHPILGAIGAAASVLPMGGRAVHESLARFAPRMFHETNIDRALGLLGGVHEDMTRRPVFLSNVPEMALGQGNNRGVRFEFDAAKLAGQVHASKPGLAFSGPQGAGEFVAINNPQVAYMDAVQSITVSPRAFASNRGYARRFHDVVLPVLEQQGWVKEKLPDGAIRLTRGAP